ncbi:MAG: SsrA-binding protein SmpB [Planctomycetes bacterium]|nr:SsrA-binding protein SmpB [Planctomycetota bacterium]
MKGNGDAVKIVQKNRKAFFDYEISDRFEAGLVLTGPEVKSIRDGNVSIHEAYARLTNGEAWVVNMEIGHYANAGPFQHEPKRPRKLLLKKRELQKLAGKLSERGLTLIPLALYFKKGFAKLELGVARGKRKYDKREVIRKREVERDLRRRMSRG